MALQLQLWNNFSKRERSTAQPATNPDAIISVEMKEDTSLVQPDFLLDGEGLSARYAKFQNRFYFINDIKRGITGQYEISCNTDYGATYKTEIGNSTFFVERASHTYDVNITDPYISQKQNYAITQTQKNVLGDISGFLTAGGGGFIVRVVGAQDEEATPSLMNPGITSYLVLPIDLQRILRFLFTDSNFTDVIADATVKAFFNPFQYIVDIKWVPIDKFAYELAHSPVILQKIKIGWWDTLVYGIVINNYEYSSTELSTFTKRFNDFRDYDSNWTKFKAYFPLIGSFEIDPNDVYKNDLYSHYMIDMISGVGQFFLTHGSNTASGAKIIYQQSFEFGVPVQIGQLATDVLKIGSDVVGGVASAVSKNFISAGSAAVDAVMNVVQPTPTIKGQTGSRIIYGNPYASILRYSCDGAEIPVYYSGRPLYQHKKISDIPGYIKCSEADIQINGLSGDREAVNSLLNGGFFYE